MQKTRSVSESETTSEWRDGEAGRRGARSHKVTFTLDFTHYSYFRSFWLIPCCFRVRKSL